METYDFESLAKALDEGRIDDFKHEVLQRLDLLNSGFDELDDPLLQIVIRWAPEERLLEILSWLLDMGADPNHHHPDDCTPLWSAVVNNQTEVVELLLARGADPNILLFDKDDPSTALSTAITDNWLHQYYLEDIRGTVEWSNHPSHWETFEKEQLAVQEFPKIIRLLEEAGAKVPSDLMEHWSDAFAWLKGRQIIDPQTGQVVDMAEIRPNGPYGVVSPFSTFRTDRQDWLNSMTLGDDLDRLLGNIRYSPQGRYYFLPYEESDLGKLLNLDMIRILDEKNRRCAILSRGGAEWLIESEHAVAMRTALFTGANNRPANERHEEEGFDDYPLEIKEHNIKKSQRCYYCEQGMNLDTGPEAFVAGTFAPVCWSCVCLMAPELAQELEDAKACFFRTNRRALQ
jgi:hypothetical protein